jgi:Mor family transcriptional regulator
MNKPQLTHVEIGRLGAIARNNKPKEELAAINRKIVAIRLKNNPNSYKEMAAKGGRASRGGGAKRVLSNAQVLALQQQVREGKPRAELAKQYKISVSSVFRYCKLYGLTQND